MWVFSFPNPVNEYAARTVAAGVLVMAVAAIAFRQPWILVPLAYGFWARVLTGPKLSPLGQLATRVIAPRLPWAPEDWCPGPPSASPRPWAWPSPPPPWCCGSGSISPPPPGWWWRCWPLAALLESAFAICLGCIVFGYLMKVGVIPEEVCEACVDISRRHPPASVGHTG